jgi:hypothetical protein
MLSTDLIDLIATADDKSGHHILWVNHVGDVFLSCIGFDAPAHWAKKNRGVIKFRYEAFACGNGYCGVEAAKDVLYVEQTLRRLKQDWAHGRSSFIDY